jgi:hypothetical protein
MSEQMAGTDVRPGAWTLALSHGTLECKEIEPTRRFYSEFLGLETLRRGDLAIWFRCGGGWMVASVCTSEKQVSLPIESRWCLDWPHPPRSTRRTKRPCSSPTNTASRRCCR